MTTETTTGDIGEETAKRVKYLAAQHFTDQHIADELGVEMEQVVELREAAGIAEQREPGWAASRGDTLDPAVVRPPMSEEEARTCVGAIRAHLQNARRLLLDLYEREGWKALGYASWRECVVEEFDQSQAQLYRQLQAATLERRVSPNGEIGEIPEGSLRPLSKLTPLEQRDAWEEAVREADGGQPTGKTVEAVVDRRLGATISPAAPTGAPTEGEGEESHVIAVRVCVVCGCTDDDACVDGPDGRCSWVEDPLGWGEPVCSACETFRAGWTDGQGQALAPAPDEEPEERSIHFSSESSEWYTPREIIDAALATMGAIDLDPCAPPLELREAQGLAINAAVAHFTEEDDGLSHDWLGKVFMNPPYGRQIGRWTGHLVEQFKVGHVTEAIALVPSRTDTEWFQDFRQYPVCFVSGRLEFDRPESVKEAYPAPFPSAVFYLGPKVDEFVWAFTQLGQIRPRCV